jgi:hypothetical protein
VSEQPPPRIDDDHAFRPIPLQIRDVRADQPVADGFVCGLPTWDADCG